MSTDSVFIYHTHSEIMKPLDAFRVAFGFVKKIGKQNTPSEETNPWFPDETNSGRTSGSEGFGVASIEAGSQDHHSTSSGSAEEWDSHGAANWEEQEERPKTPVTLSFSSPLPSSSKPLLLNGVELDSTHHPFLTVFLAQKRYMDMPFSIAHRLLRFAMGLTSDAAFDFLRRYRSDSLYLYGKMRSTADECELQHWIKEIMDRRYGCDDVHWKLALERITDERRFENLRNYATHRWVYTSNQFLVAVGFLAAVSDEERLSKLEEMLEIVYLTFAESDRTVTEPEKEVMERALGMTPTEPTTIHQTLYRVQEVLEKGFFEFWTKEDPDGLTDIAWDVSEKSSGNELAPGTAGVGIDCSERMELHRWRDAGHFPHIFPRRKDVYNPDKTEATYFKERLQSAYSLRNFVAHPVSRPIVKPPPLSIMLDDAADLARDLRDEAGREEILRLREKPCLQPVFAEEEPRTQDWVKEREGEKKEARAKWAGHLEASTLLHCQPIDDLAELSEEENCQAASANDNTSTEGGLEAKGIKQDITSMEDDVERDRIEESETMWEMIGEDAFQLHY